MLNVNTPSFEKWLSIEGIILEDIVLSLKEKGLAHFENGELGLLTDKCQVVIVDGKWYAAENKTGRLTNWLMRKSE
ncbi:hypothetical protein [Bacillus mycoides]|uniref:hypothetical protein n=1 Tax=Bacillus mycoides TaxID=1405 RepID=UPI001C0199E4|nr:hypothetical protein [Bacillus mycoides]QWG61989.1 hypothetical protein EXW60_13515 [Bacillus mycoides]